MPRIVFENDSDRLVYLEMLQADSQLYRLSIAGFCLMSNHVHLAVTPQRLDALALALRHTHGRYATDHNTRQGTSGPIWQGR